MRRNGRPEERCRIRSPQLRVDWSSRNGSSSGEQNGEGAAVTTMVKCAGGAATGPIPAMARHQEGHSVGRPGARHQRGVTSQATSRRSPNPCSRWWRQSTAGPDPCAERPDPHRCASTAQPVPSPSTIQRRPKLARLYWQKRAIPPRIVPLTRSASPNGSCTINCVGVMPTTISQWPPPPGLLIGPRCRYPQRTGIPAAIYSSGVEKLAWLERSGAQP